MPTTRIVAGQSSDYPSNFAPIQNEMVDHIDDPHYVGSAGDLADGDLLRYDAATGRLVAAASNTLTTQAAVSAWDSTVSYPPDAVVSHSGTAWVANVQTVVGAEPGVSASWDALNAVDETHRTAANAHADLFVPASIIAPGVNGIVGDGVADDAAAINAVYTAAGANGHVVWADATYRAAALIRASCSTTSHDAVLNVDHPGGGIEVRHIDGLANRLQRRSSSLPRVERVTLNWAEDSAGVRIVNVMSSPFIAIPSVTGFTRGVELAGAGAGVAYLNILLGAITNNKENFSARPGTDGWCNQVQVYGGRLAHTSDVIPADPPTAGVRQIAFHTGLSDPNGITFVGTSVEGGGPEHHIWLDAGSYNTFFGLRFEVPNGGGRIHFGATTTSNQILLGYEAQGVVVTEAAGAARNSVVSAQGTRQNGSGTAGVWQVSNESGDGSPVVSILPSGRVFDAAATEWMMRLAGTGLQGKLSTDAHPRVDIIPAFGRLRLGTGAAAATAGLRCEWSDLLYVENAHLVFPADNTYDVGQVGGRRPRDAHVARKVKVAGGAEFHSGAGTPEGIVTAPVGSLFGRTDGTAGATLYVKESGTGNTGWVAK